jgi:hypothetical protein
MNNVSEAGSDFIRDLGDAVRKNPVSAALIGMGMLWLFSGSKSAAKAGEYVRKGMDRVPDAFEGARSALQSGAGTVGERAEWRIPWVAQPIMGGSMPTQPQAISPRFPRREWTPSAQFVQIFPRCSGLNHWRWERSALRSALASPWRCRRANWNQTTWATPAKPLRQKPPNSRPNRPVAWRQPRETCSKLSPTRLRGKA